MSIDHYVKKNKAINKILKYIEEPDKSSVRIHLMQEESRWHVLYLFIKSDLRLWSVMASPLGVAIHYNRGRKFFHSELIYAMMYYFYCKKK